MATVNLSPTFGVGYQAFTTSGIPLNAGLLYTYVAGSTTAKETYTTSAGSVQNANPIVLGADGRPANEIWLVQGVSYRFDLKDSSGSLIQTYDNINGVNDLTNFTGGTQFSTGIGVAGATKQASGVAFPSVAVAVSDANTLDDYREATMSMTLSGFTATQTSTVAITKIGNQVTIDNLTWSGTSNSTGKTTSPAIAAGYRPATQKYFVIAANDNGGAAVAARGVLHTDGTIDFYKDMNGGGFTAAGACSIGPGSFTYTLV